MHEDDGRSGHGLPLIARARGGMSSAAITQGYREQSFLEVQYQVAKKIIYLDFLDCERRRFPKSQRPKGNIIRRQGRRT